MHVLIKYTVRPEEMAEHLRLMAEVYADLQRRAPADLAYVTYQLEDGNSFVELFSSDAGPGPLAASKAFARFRATLDARCEAVPGITELQLVGSYSPTSVHAAPVQEQA